MEENASGMARNPSFITKQRLRMEENASGMARNPSFITKQRLRMEENASGMVRKEKSKKIKNKGIEEEKNVIRLLYNDTPSDGYDEEKSPSPKRMRMEENASGMARKEKSKKRKNKGIEEEKNAIRLLYNDTPSDGYDEEKSPSSKSMRMEENTSGMARKEKSKKRKNKGIEEEKNAIRLLYNDTPSDGYDEEKSPSSKSIRMEENASGMARKEKSKKRKNKGIEEEKNVIRLLYNDTSSDGYNEEKSPSLKRMMKPPPFSKVWSDEDEISILRGMIKFKEQTSRHAAQNIPEFHAFIFQSLTLQPTLIQLREKIRRFREKYEKTSARRRNSSTTPHQLQLFQLCHKIWNPNLSATNIGQEKPKKQNNIPEIGPHKIPETGQQQHRIIPKSGLDAQALHELFKRIATDIELVVNSEACLRGSKKEVELRVIDITLESMLLGIKVGTLVQEKATSPELRNSPQLLEQEALKAYLETKIEHAQLLLNAYNSYIKGHSNEGQSSASAVKE